MPEESKLEQKYKQATEPVKFTEEEMKSVKDMRDKYTTVQVQLGQIGVARIRLEQEIISLNKASDSLKNDFIETQKIEEKFLTGVKEKYGDGELNPETGIFTPFPEENK